MKPGFPQRKKHPVLGCMARKLKAFGYERETWWVPDKVDRIR